MQILMVQGTTSWAGGEAVALAIARGSDELEVEFFVPGQLDAGTRARYAPFPVREAEAANLRSVVRSLREALATAQPDIVHAHGTRAKIFLWLAFLYSAKRPRSMYTVHGFHIAHRSFLKRQAAFLLERISNRWMDEVVATNNADRDAVLASKTAPAGKLSVVYNGIDVPRFAGGSREAGRESMGVGADVPVVLSVARMHPQKDIPTALRAWKLVTERHPGAVLALSGDGPLEAEMKDLAAELGLAGSVRFLGYTKNGPDLLAACDAVLLATHWEGMALVPLEAGAAGKPIVGTDVPGMSETVRNGRNGLLVRHADPEDLAEKLGRLLGDESLRRAMGSEGRRMVDAEFTEARMAKAYLERYALLAGVRS